MASWKSAGLGFEMANKSPADEEQIMTLREVAAYLKLNDKTIYRLAQAEKIPAFKVGGSWRFRRSDLVCWIEENMTGERDGGD